MWRFLVRHRLRVGAWLAFVVVPLALAVVLAPSAPSSNELDCRERTLASLRGHLLFFGVDVSHLDDQELEAALRRATEILGEAARESSVTVEEAGQALRLLAQMGETGKP